MKLQMKNSFIRPMFRFCLLANPVINTIFLYEMYRNSGQDNFITYVMLGAGLMGLWSCICFSSAGDINRERYSGTLPLIFATPTSFGLIILGKVMGNTLISILTMVISFVTAEILTGAPIGIGSPVYLAISLLMAVICFSVVSVCIAYLLTVSRKTELYMNLIEIPITLLCGFTFPVEILPAWVQYISDALAPTWVVKLIRMSIAGVTDVSAFRNDFFILNFVTAIYVVGAVVLYRVIENQIRIKATLEVC